MAFADLLEKTGGMGRFQITQLVFLCFPIVFMASHNLLQNFSAAIPRHMCKINDTGFSNRSREGWAWAFRPLDSKGRPESCFEFVEEQWITMDSNATWYNSTDMETRPCTNGWEYDRTEFPSTIITEWDLVCSKKSRRQLAQSLYMSGVLVGGVVLGGLSDRYGRRALLIWSYLQMAVSGICTAFAPNYLTYCVFRFLTGMALSGMGINTSALIVEWVPTKVRTIAGTLSAYSYTIGQLVLAALAYSIREWRWLQLCVSAPYFIFFLYSWLFPESARWLVLYGKTDRAVKEMKRVARFNGKKEEAEKISAETLKADMKKELASGSSSYTYYDLVRTNTMRKISFGVSCIWFSTSFAYYGLAMDLQKFGVSIYLIQVIFGAVDFPAKLISTTSMICIGRRVTQFCTLCLGGVTLLANIFVPSEQQILRTCLAVFGKGCMSGSFCCIFLFTMELYPTVIRQSGLGLANTMARVGGIVAPLVMMLGDFYPFLPPVIYGGSLIVSALVLYILPETGNRPLPDTIEEVEALSKTSPDNEKKETVPLKTVTENPLNTTV
ncbi:solute carrier family 22 member 6-A-like [Gastrophryne carolinensis]